MVSNSMSDMFGTERAVSFPFGLTVQTIIDAKHSSCVSTGASLADKNLEAQSK
jgi:hypothetical protein